MKRGILLCGAALAISSTLVTAQDAPKSLLPPGFDNPAKSPAPAPAPTPAPAPRASAAPAVPGGGGSSVPVVQPLPSGSSAEPGSSPDLPDDLPSLAEIENMSNDELDELLGLRPKYDIPPAARRSLESIGVLGAQEGGLPVRSLARQPASLVRAALAGIESPMVSRWGHILLRRALASRLDTPEGMNPVEFAALRAAALNTIGEHVAARALVQDVDTLNYNGALTSAALDAYIGTADIVGACPIVRLKSGERKGPQWTMLGSICAAYAGEESQANSQLDRALRREIAPQIDVLLAQRFAGAAGRGRRAVNIEWDGVSQLTPWRFALARAVGIEIPENLRDGAGDYYALASATGPMMPIAQRARDADIAAQRGVLSASAVVDLFSQVYAVPGLEGDIAQRADTLRTAYVAQDPAARIAAITALWGSIDRPLYGRQVLTAYAAARLTPSDDMAEQAPHLIASMLTAGLDRDAALWAPVVDDGSAGWALLAVAGPDGGAPVSSGDVNSFASDDNSTGQRRSKFLLAGLAGLGRLSQADTNSLADDLGVNLARETRWSRAISGAAQVNNPALVAMLAGLGMQGDGWDKMTARHLYHIVSALNRVGLSAEARMIAAEAVARG
ncbi:hypothetical protein [Altererythrobacter aquiaggeris]|uniref:hypothetical protein n=1 Tax=Aestuarierythrobacter aquiaggeris TaxID=1898396 RepID=UPI00301A0355